MLAVSSAAMRWLLPLLLLAGCSHQIDPRSLARVDTLRLAEGKRGEGSAVVVSANGDLLTAAHVVDGAEVVSVTLADGRKLVAEVTESDADADLATLHVDATGLRPVSRARSKAVVGEVVKTFGRHANGGAGRVTGDDAPAEGRWLYTDAPFGPGDSGGALVNKRGELVGVLLGEAVGGRLAAVRADADAASTSP